MAANILYDSISVVYRNTWKNQNGHIRTQVYPTDERAIASVKCNPNHLYQEIATPVFTSLCLIPGG